MFNERTLTSSGLKTSLTDEGKSTVNLRQARHLQLQVPNVVWSSSFRNNNSHLERSASDEVLQKTWEMCGLF